MCGNTLRVSPTRRLAHTLLFEAGHMATADYPHGPSCPSRGQVELTPHSLSGISQGTQVSKDTLLGIPRTQLASQQLDKGLSIFGQDHLLLQRSTGGPGTTADAPSLAKTVILCNSLQRKDLWFPRQSRSNESIPVSMCVCTRTLVCIVCQQTPHVSNLGRPPEEL